MEPYMSEPSGLRSFDLIKQVKSDGNSTTPTKPGVSGSTVAAWMRNLNFPV